MATREDICAAFADPQIDGMDCPYDAIGEMLLEWTGFQNAYSLMIAAGDVEATTWIQFCVRYAIWFHDPIVESKFLSVLEEFIRKYVGV